MVAFAPPAHSIWATFLPPRSAAWARFSAFSTLAAKAAVLLAKVPPLMWNVLLVEPWTPGHAPVARLYQPAPVFGGASVRRPFPAADVPFLRNEPIVGSRPWAAYLATRSWRMPSATKKTAVPASGPFPGGGAADTGPASIVASRPATAMSVTGRRSRDRFTTETSMPKGIRLGARGARRPAPQLHRTARDGAGRTITDRRRRVHAGSRGPARRSRWLKPDKAVVRGPRHRCRASVEGAVAMKDRWESARPCPCRAWPRPGGGVVPPSVLVLEQ